ncbi:MAG: EAL domain-containing protein, partial [Oceanospirillaceae bacterium]|nr:EAL domain-containing protein [Oceanospirillaceae bacterium]
MGKKTIAEFVENSEIADRLREVGVEYAQGYGIAKPHSIELLADLSLTPVTTVAEAENEVCV